MARITGRANLEQWLDGRSAYVGVLTATRAALRAYPRLLRDCTGSDDEAKRSLLVASRALGASAVAVIEPSVEVRICAGEAADLTGNALKSSSSDAATAAAYAAFAAADVSASTDAAVYACIYAADAITADAAAYAALSEDTTLTEITSPQTAFQARLWQTGDMPNGLAADWRTVRDAPGIRRGSWGFWVSWYEGFLNGQPLDWDLQREVALIPNEDWEKGAEHIASKIREIQARYDLTKRIGDLESALVEPRKAVRGIGDNNPPEPIEETSIPTIVTLIWEPVQELKAELESPNPSPGKVRRAGQALREIAEAIIAWCARKLDIAASEAAKTIGKWGAGAGIAWLVANQSGLTDALIGVAEAAKVWAGTLPGGGP